MAVAFLLLVALPLAYATSPLLELSRPWALVLLLSLALFVLIGTWRRDRQLHDRRRRVLRRAQQFFAGGVGYVLLRGQFPATELAGILPVFLPPAVALALMPRRASPGKLLRPASALLALVFAGLLLLTAARSGLVACALALVVMLAAMGWRGWLALASAALVAGFWFAHAGWTTFAEFLIFDHKVEQLTLDSLLTGRPQIWDRALFALGDFPLFGLGLGASSSAIAELYPYYKTEPVFEDAHNLYLQTALDLGIPGLVAFLAILALAGERLAAACRRSRPGGPERFWALGLAAALGGQVLYGLVDAVALGTAGSLALWLLLGVIFGSLPPPARRWRWHRRPIVRRAMVRAFVAVALVAVLPLIAVRVGPNLVAARAARALFSRPELLPAAQAGLEGRGRRPCRADWLAGQVAAARGHFEERDAAWGRLLRCSGAFVQLMSQEAPQSRELAELALAGRGTSPDAHFWLARILADGVSEAERRRAAALYRSGLRLAPARAFAWQELGALLRLSDPPAALAAYGESCRHGDPMGWGCISAGLLARQQGDLDLAIRYLRRSRYPGSRERAEELERRQSAGVED